MKTEIRLKFKNLKTGILIIKEKEKEYDFLIYNDAQQTYLNEGFRRESFIIVDGEYDEEVAKEFINRIKTMLYSNLNNIINQEDCNKEKTFLGMEYNIVHIPETKLL